MTPQFSVFIATSLDGFIARKDGSIDWLEAANRAVPVGEDCGYAQFMKSVDALVMGRETFEKVLSFPEWPYGDKPVWVCSRTMLTLPPGLPPQVELVEDSPPQVVARAQQRNRGRLYVDGGRLVQSFLRQGFISDLTITTVPVLLGTGRALFGNLSCDIDLQLVQSVAYPFGFVQSTYRVVA